MGFQKGSITLSPRQDIPLLLQVLHSRFITHDQLFEFMFIGCVELKRASFNWRVRRLLEAGLLTRRCARPITPSPVYSLTDVGALMLADHSPVLDSPKEKEELSTAHLTHSIELTSLHLALARQGVLDSWESEVTIRAKNELTSSGYAKDYDAIVTVRIDGRRATFALEYERTPKKSKDYFRIRQLLEQENGVPCFLYVVPEPKLAGFLLDCFAGTQAALFIGLAGDLSPSFADMPVVEAASGEVVRFGEALELRTASPRLTHESFARP
jgi:hypothetical protein